MKTQSEYRDWTLDSHLYMHDLAEPGTSDTPIFDQLRREQNSRVARRLFIKKVRAFFSKKA